MLKSIIPVWKNSNMRDSIGNSLIQKKKNKKNCKHRACACLYDSFFLSSSVVCACLYDSFLPLWFFPASMILSFFFFCGMCLIVLCGFFYKSYIYCGCAIRCAFCVCSVFAHALMMTYDDVAGLMIALLFAGQHTSSISSAWTGCYLLRDKDLMYAPLVHTHTHTYAITSHAHIQSHTHTLPTTRTQAHSHAHIAHSHIHALHTTRT